MIHQLTINNFTTVEHIELEFSAGMTVVTGETGAGKSVMLEALALVVGGRADSKAVRAGAGRADIHAIFDLGELRAARSWLKQRDLYDGKECLLRRVITCEGRSRAYINGQPVPVQDLRALGALMIDVHSQHEQQNLLRREAHRELLDGFADCSALSTQLGDVYRAWKQAEREYSVMQSGADEQHAQAQLLDYQLGELQELALQEKEVEELEQAQKQLGHADALGQACQQALNLCEEGSDSTILGLCSQARAALESHLEHSPAVGESIELLGNALIQVQEASYSLRQQIDDLKLDPERQQRVEQRLSTVYQLARKHRVKPQELCGLQQQLQAEAEKLNNSDEHLETLRAEIETQKKCYEKLARQLSDKRAPAAEKLQTQVKQQLKQLKMQSCEFKVQLAPLDEGAQGSHGQETVEFLISTIPGKEPQALNKVASGGELSRISLAIQVVTASKSSVPTLVFDEVDVGIGGSVADVVGRMLRKLASHSQVICVTHLAQVAAQGHHHLGVSKFSQRKSVLTKLRLLENDDKVNEIARMLGGMSITEQSREHAKSMLAS